MLARKHKTEVLWQDLRDSNKNYSTKQSKTRQSKWREFCRQTESVKESARMNNILKNTSNKKERLEYVYKSKTDNTLTKNDAETLNVMAETHFQNGPSTHHTEPNTPNETQPNNIEQIYNPDRIRKALFTFEPYKAAGPDTLKPLIIQKSWPIIKDIVRNLMIRSQELQHIPKPWQEATAIFLPKPGKPDYNKPNSYRTITLAPVLLKLQEKVILWHMQHDLGMEDSLNKKQFGFRKGMSTETALHKVVHTIERRIAKKGYVLGTFLDIEGAFDNVSFSSISEAIYKSPLDNHTAGWIINMVKNRYVTINHKSATKRIKVCKGCPQGGILSPFLWNLVIDDLLNYSAKHIPGYLQAFADDLITLAEGNDLEVIWERTQKTINTIESWCKSKGLNICALKTKIVMFTWNRKWSIRPIKVGGITIELSKEVKLLGITLDHKLNFNTHIDKTTKKCLGILMQCKRAIGPTWGLSPKVCKWIYTAIVRPVLNYAVVIWIKGTLNKNNIKKLQRIQGLALKCMTGAFPTSPHNALDYLTDTRDIINYLKGEAAKGAVRLIGLGEWTKETATSGKGIIKAHSTLTNDFLNTLNLPNPKEWDICKPILVLDRKYTITKPLEDEITQYRENLQLEIEEASKTGISLYTDGSRTDQGVGAGFIITPDNTSNSYKLNNNSSVFIAELIAITEGTKQLLNKENSTITIWTDSLSALQALEGRIYRSHSVKNCHNILDRLATNNQVELKWIAAHVGHWGNEQADIKAKEGTGCDNLLNSLVPYKYIKQTINKQTKKLATARWKANPHKHTELMTHTDPTKFINTLKRNLNNRNRYRTGINLITGHIGLNTHLNKIMLTDQPDCPTCGELEETVAHFLAQCPTYRQKRGQYMDTFYDSITDILEKTKFDKIISYAMSTKRFLLAEDEDNSGVT